MNTEEIKEGLEKNKVWRKNNLEFAISESKDIPSTVTPYRLPNVISWKLFVDNKQYGAYTNYVDGGLEVTLYLLFKQIKNTVKALVEKDSDLILNLILDDNVIEHKLEGKRELFDRVLKEEGYKDSNTEFLMSEEGVTLENPYNNFTTISIKVKQYNKYYGAWTNIKNNDFNEENLKLILDNFCNLRYRNKLSEIIEGGHITNSYVEIIK